MPVRRALVIPVLILGAAVLGCGGGWGETFDSATGCCTYHGNEAGRDRGPEKCWEEGDHADAECCLPGGDTTAVVCDDTGG